MRAVALTFLAALVVYVGAYSWLSHRQTHRGPWELQFIRSAFGVPAVVIDQPRLGISNVILRFPDERLSATWTNRWIAFDSPTRPVPFGRLVFHDLMFLPGTLTFDFFGAEVELLPRTLVLNRVEHPWRCGETISLWASNRPSGPPVE